MKQLDLERLLAERDHRTLGPAADGPGNVKSGARPETRPQG